jgi:PAS domain S-box-containing protein
LGDTLAAALPFGFDIVAEDGTLLFLSERQARELGEDAVGKKCWDVYRDDRTQCVQCPLRQGLEEGQTATTVSDGVLGGRSFEIHHAGMRYEGRAAILEIFEDITEQEQVETARLSSEAQLQFVVGQVPAVLWTTDQELRFTSSGGAGLKGLGLKPGETVGVTLFEYFRTDDPEFEPIAAHRRALAGEPVSYDFEWRGNVYEVLVEPLRDRGGGVIGCIGLALDITERKGRERALRLTQFAVDSIGDAAFWMTADGKVFYVNEAACRALGYTVDELHNMTVSDIDPNFPQRLWVEYWENLQRHRTVTVESQHRAKDGRLIPVEIVTNYMEFDGSEYAVALARDITERKRVENTLVRSEANYRALVEHANYGIYRSSPEGRFLSVNPALVEILGYESQAELTQVSMERDIYADPDERSRLVAEYRRRGRIEGVDVAWKRKDGRVITVHLSGRPIHNEIGELEGFEMFVEDVTERRTLEAQLRQAQKMEAIGQLTGGIAHDFNNLLSVITLNAQMVAGAFESQQNDLLPEVQDIQDAARKAATMTRQLLGFSRHADLQMVPTDLGRVVTNLSTMLRRVLPEDIRVRLAADEPVSATAADAGAVEQMLLNLATNARDAMPDGGVLRIEVEDCDVDDVIRASQPWITPGRYIRIAVRDTGVGMDEETRNRVFEPFFTTKAPGVGTGLGMAMVYGLTKQHGGYVSVTSAVGQGTTVQLYFPVVPEEAHPLRDRESLAGAPGGEETILLVEDEDTLRRSAKRVLERYGYRVLVATDGQEALELFRARGAEIDLVISDLVMPKLGGGQLYRALREEGATTRFMLTSGYTGREEQAREQLDPSLTVLQKPWVLGELLRRVRQTLDQS